MELLSLLIALLLIGANVALIYGISLGGEKIGLALCLPA